MVLSVSSGNLVRGSVRSTNKKEQTPLVECLGYVAFGAYRLGGILPGEEKIRAVST